MDKLTELGESVQNGDRDGALRLTNELLDSGIEPMMIVDDGLVPGMTAIGDRFKSGEVFVPEMMMAALAMKPCVAFLEPMLITMGQAPEHTVVIGTVQGDLHDIGKSLVAMMWQGANLSVVDLGTNISPAGFVEAVQRTGADLVGLSALLTTTMPAMKSTIDALKAAGLNSVKVVIGGAPITQEYAMEIGADAYAPDAASAVDVVKRVLAS